MLKCHVCLQDTKTQDMFSWKTLQLCKTCLLKPVLRHDLLEDMSLCLRLCLHCCYFLLFILLKTCLLPRHVLNMSPRHHFYSVCMHGLFSPMARHRVLGRNWHDRGSPWRRGWSKNHVNKCIFFWKRYFKCWKCWFGFVLLHFKVRIVNFGKVLRKLVKIYVKYFVFNKETENNNVSMFSQKTSLSTTYIVY